MNDLFLRACRKQPVERTPVWMMRQAGRYLPEYRKIRAKTDFLTLCKTPELAAEVSIQPVDLVGVDACIIFSDILVVPEAMGMELIIEEGKGGPRFPNPIRSIQQIKGLHIPDPTKELKYVMDAVTLTRRNLGGRVPLIGFSGSPWTLATYMVEGHGSKNFKHVKELIYTQPLEAHLLLDKLSKAVGDYLCAKIDAGAQTVQIFDTWGGILPPDEFIEFSLQYITKVVEQVKSKGVPIIVFCKDCVHSLDAIADIGRCCRSRLDDRYRKCSHANREQSGITRKSRSHRSLCLPRKNPLICNSHIGKVRKRIWSHIQSWTWHPSGYST